MQKIRKGDTVVVLTGKDKGREGEVLSVLPKDNRAVVRGINMVKRHQRQTAAAESGIVNKEASMNLSNLAIKDPKDGKATRIGFKINEDGTKVRVSKRTGEVING
ncbi:MAG: 50S ribosomal protein L24 [Pseudomonadota bacterium]